MESTAALLELEVEDDVRKVFGSSSPSSLEPLEDLEACSEAEGGLRGEPGDPEEMGLFAAADKRFLPVEEKLNFSKVFLMVKRFQTAAAPRTTAEHFGVCPFSSNAPFLNVLLFPEG